MRLDAAMEALAQARDFLVRQLEYQMVQLQEMRSALSHLVSETPAAETAPPPAPVAPVAQPVTQPVEMPASGTAAPAYAGVASEQPMEALFEAVTEPEPASAPSLFDQAPASTWGFPHSNHGGTQVLEAEIVSAPVTARPAAPAPTTTMPAAPAPVTTMPAINIPAVTIPTVTLPVAAEPESSAVMTLDTDEKIDPALEKATIEELNEALSRAFAQIASRGGMKR